MFNRLIRILREFKTPECQIIRQSSSAQIPVLGSEGAAGYDLTSSEEAVLPKHGRVLVHTGLLVAPPRGYHIEVRPRSGLALKHGITVLNTPGTIDSDYRGEIMIILINTSDEDYTVHTGDRIAQAVIMRHESVRWREVEKFEKTARGTQGFGSTGNNS